MGETDYSAILAGVRAIVAEYSKLPDAIIRAQCRGIGREVGLVSSGDLPILAERIGIAVGMFTNPAKGAEVRSRIMTLARGA